MATGFLTPVVQRLVQLLDDEVGLVGGVKDEVSSLQAELRFINTYLEGSEGDRNPINQVAVGEIRKKANEAVGEIDIFITNAEIHARRNWMQKKLYWSRHTTMLHNVAKRIENINKEITKIFANRDKYASTVRSEASVDAEFEEALHRRRRVEEDDVVAFNNNSTALAKLFIAKGSQLDVISIIGMGGLGKTTLARKLYNSTHVGTLFARRAWVNVSQHDKTRDLLLKILKPISDELGRNLEGMREDELKEKWFNYLNGERYLVVMDDVWKIDFWDDQVRSIFPDNSNGSRILITSRIKKVASYASPTTPSYDLPFLNEDESWELFSKKWYLGQTCPPELKPLGRQLAEGCSGLPLSIVELGSLLATKEKTGRELLRYVDDVNSFLDESKGILALSYTHLPPELRSCFMYLGVYPIDFEIPVRQMIQLWIAETFISPPIDRLQMENVAEDELKKLIDGSLVQVASRSTYGRTKTCRIHDLLRDLCISESKKTNFLEVLRDSNLSSSNQSQILCIHSNNINPYISLNQSKRSRSLLFFSQGRDPYLFDPNHWQWVLKNFKLLRVLNFGRVDLCTIPSSIGEMIHLRYLSINSGKLKAIPTSICNLTNLETLDMRGTGLKRLPKGISRLRHLRNLYVFGSVKLPDDWNPNFTAMCNIQVLSTVSLNPQTIRPIVDAKLPNLRKLGLWFDSRESSEEVERVLRNLVHFLPDLKVLKIINYWEHPLPNSFPSKITKITLRQVRLEVSDCMRQLGNLPKLRIMKIQRCVLPDNLEFAESSFPILEVLKLENLRIKKWVLKESIPCLMHLVIKECIQLTALPQELKSSTLLREVEILGSNIELETKEMLEQLRMKLRINLLIKESQQAGPDL